MPPNNSYYQQPGAMPPPAQHMPQQPMQPLPGSGGGSSMKWIIIIIFLSLLLIGALAFGFWAFGERNDYKDNVDAKIEVATAEQKKVTTNELNKLHAEENKKPTKLYAGPASYGSVKFEYPKTYSAYVTNGGNSTPLDAYFHPDIVPSLTPAPGSSVRAAMALHVQVFDMSYDTVVAQRQGSIRTGTLVASPYALPEMPNQVGMKFVGKLQNQLNGTEIVLPLRDKTLVITSETDSWLPDFNTFVLPTFTFEP